MDTREWSGVDRETVMDMWDVRRAIIRRVKGMKKKKKDVWHKKKRPRGFQMGYVRLRLT